LAIRGGLKAARNGAIMCGIFLAVIEGVGIGFQRMMADQTRLDVCGDMIYSRMFLQTDTPLDIGSSASTAICRRWQDDRVTEDGIRPSFHLARRFTFGVLHSSQDLYLHRRRPGLKNEIPLDGSCEVERANSLSRISLIKHQVASDVHNAAPCPGTCTLPRCMTSLGAIPHLDLNSSDAGNGCRRVPP
jgi:hypothetical protein